jgi:N-acetylglutamate synthase-like GNAT family acetyltransferase
MIRFFEKRDAKTCSKMVSECVEKSPGFNRYEALFVKKFNTPRGLIKKSREFPLFVYEKKGGMAGVCGLKENEVTGLYIRLDEQNKGVGKKLVKHIENYAKKKGINWLIVSSAVSARGFWKGLGYKEKSGITKKINTREFKNIIMEREI